MLLKHFLLGALLALGSVTALPNPETDLHDVEARDNKHHRPRCGKDADFDDIKNKCICKDEGKEFHREHKICRCPEDQMKDPDDPHKCVCKDQDKKLIMGVCKCKGDLEPRNGKCKCPQGTRRHGYKCICKDQDKKLIMGVCKCKGDLEPRNGKCKCPQGTRRHGYKCKRHGH
ncbi:hypothetical protein BFJ66_g8709 [Fusarium oxysporum f. sp. cepae]|uniref:Uncharacterized protein n=1 Tax=Fusarium oxysporum f. sp. cepae TaxID=396571 RepID=A0A3L6MZV6_FUSOX|nr:hypothetical protein BFJ65_g16209 [Fusarium oxysporum f. sp. cepae]RKK46158.1 hypothetical protein BFJ66_g8709 [Fusarium oxysporum f. sp. cepae]RKK50602.1 hypothetical protein BFJ67_g6389 [Fusarium oxysporum f. sp. cepae]